MRTIEADKGLSIYLAAQQAIKQAKKDLTEVRLKFNDISITVSPQSYDCDIATIYHYKCEVRRLLAQG